MKKIKIFPAPHVELRVHVSDEMVKDFNECYERAKEEEYDGKSCEACSWHDVAIGGTSMCELKEIEQLLRDESIGLDPETVKKSEPDWKEKVMNTFLGGR